MEIQTITGLTQEDFLKAMGIDAIDRCEAEMARMIEVGEMARVDCPVEHSFTPGIYVRKITMPQGSLVSSKTHGLQHPFVITKGDVSVWSNGRVTRYKAPYMGITEPGTKRLLFCHTDVEWATYQPNPDNTHDLDLIESRLMLPHKNPYVDFEPNKADGSLPDSLKLEGGAL